MRNGILILTAAVALCLLSMPLGAQELDEHLAVFKPYIGKTWKGRLSEPGAEEESWDVSRWERALNGKAVRILHSVNDGEYGGETIVYWNREKEEVEYYYFTTAGFYTIGTMEINDDGTFSAMEDVTGNANGITKVRSTSTVLPDGGLQAEAEYLKNGEWVPGHKILYHEAPDAEVVFR